jgi:hypothetical protein
MSGGSFDYAYHRVEDFSDALKRKLDEWAQDADISFSPVTMKLLEDCIEQADRAAGMMRAVEFLASGDIGEESFVQEMLKQALDELKDA